MGYPLVDHADFERVGGECSDDSVATGVAFRRGGHGLGDATSWREGELHFPPNPTIDDPTEGLVLRLLCAGPSPLVAIFLACSDRRQPRTSRASLP